MCMYGQCRMAYRCMCVPVRAWWDGYWVGTWGGIPGGYTGYYPATCPREEDPYPSEAGPGSPSGGWSGWGYGSGRVTRRRCPRTTLRARSVRPAAFPVLGPLIADSWPIWRDLTTFLMKLVKTAKCHQNVSKRPPLVPIPKTGPESHLLKFLDFHFHEPSLTRN